MLAKLPLGSNAMLLIENEVFKELYPYRQTHPHASESAGVLLGYRRECHIGPAVGDWIKRGGEAL